MDSATTQVHGPSAAMVIATDWVPLFISLVAILARLHWRFNIARQRLPASDAWLCLAWFAAAVNACFDIYWFRSGVLTPDMDYLLAAYQGTPEELQKLLRAIWGSNIPFFTSFYLCKATLLSFYLQILPSSMRKYRAVVQATVAYTAIGYIVSILLNIFLCFPIQRNWALDSTVCGSEAYVVFIVAWALHFSSDIMIFLLPFPMLYKLQVHKIARIGAYCTFGLGGINITVCLTRFLIVYLASEGKPLSFTLVNLWSNLDASTAVLIACLPSLRPYLHLINQALSSRSQSSRTSSRRTKLFSKNSSKNFERIQDNLRMNRLGTSVDELSGTLE